MSHQEVVSLNRFTYKVIEMLVIHLDISEVYGNYVFSEFASEESFYKYVEELKKEFCEEIEEQGTWISFVYPCIRKITRLDGGDTIIFCEVGWNKIAPLVKNMDLADYCGLLYKDERGMWKY